MSVSEGIEQRLKSQAKSLGFALCGIARATAADGFERFTEWLGHGYAGEMSYLHEQAEARQHPESILRDVQSVLMVGLTYGEHAFDSEIRPGSRIAKYAMGPDYHRFMWDRLNALGAWLEGDIPGTRIRGVADTAPLLERDFARRAGLGWIGKNTMLINPQLGSFFLLGALLTTLELQPDPAFNTRHCGTCTACLVACPTDAFPEPGCLDARKCISYLTIELNSPIPEEFRPQMGEWLFGCDVCQDVCPWNNHVETDPGLPTRPDLIAIDPASLLQMTPTELRRRFKGTAMLRANWTGMLRNAAIVLGNRGDRSAMPVLRQAMQWDDPIVRDACQWAIDRIERFTGSTPRIPSE